MIKSTTRRTDWSEALDKRSEEGCCRVCRGFGGWEDGEFVGSIECAHLVGRKHDPVERGPRGGQVRVVPREATIPLCSQCHYQYDSHLLDIIPFTTWPEQAFAVSKLGIQRAYERLGGRA